MKALKQKLQVAKQETKPENPEQEVEWLTKRLEVAMEAVLTSEEIIEHERANRKEMSRDLKERNATLMELINNER